MKETKILIVRLSALGDVVIATPLIRALYESYENVSIDWLVQPEAAGLIQANPYLSRVIIWPKSEWLKLFKKLNWIQLIRKIILFRNLLKNNKYSIVVDTQGLMKSGFLAWLSGAPDRIGLNSHEGSQWLMTRVVQGDKGGARIGSEYLSLAKALNLSHHLFEMHIATSKEDVSYTQTVINEHRLESGYAIICPFTTRPQKHWFNDDWQSLFRRLNDECSLKVMVLGGPGDFDAALNLINDSEQIVNLVGQTSLSQAAALIQRASLVVGVDTGLTHIGIAMSAPTIGLFGSTRPYLDTGKDNAKVIYHPLDCSPCRRNPTCDDRFDCMRGIKVDEVLELAKTLMRLGR